LTKQKLFKVKDGNEKSGFSYWKRSYLGCQELAVAEL
jgi:hypothetical protein